MTIGAPAFAGSRAIPHMLERPRHVGARGTLDADGRVAPWGAATLEDTGAPFLADPDAASDAARAVDDEQLAVVARDDAEPPTPARGVEDADGDTRRAEAAEERT